MKTLRSNETCWCGSGAKFKRCHGEARRLRRPVVVAGQVSPMRLVPDSIQRPPRSVRRSADPEIQDAASLDRLRVACRVAAEVLSETARAVAVGITTDELDVIAHEAYLSRAAYPSTLGYHGFPKSICTSVDGVICHGIPDDRPLADGDIVNIDVTAYIEGMHGDTSATFAVGNVEPATRALIDHTRTATLLGIAAVAPGRPIGTIAKAIEPYAAAHGYGVIREYGGHGIGSVFHAAPHVNHRIERGDDLVLEPGMTFTIEPMLTTGRPTYRTAPDGWTEHTEDAMPSAQFEHTVVVTSAGVEILTVDEHGRSEAGTLELVAS